MNLKKFLAASLALTILLPFCHLIPGSSAANGSWQNISWSVSEGTLTVTGGDIPGTSPSSNPPWQKFAKNITTLCIGDGVSSIGERAFEDLFNLSSVNFGETAFIERLAFSGCSSLTELSLPEGLMSVGDFAFAECSSLRSVSLPSSIIFFSHSALDSTPALEKISSSSRSFPVTEDGALLNGNTLLRFPENSPSSSLTTPDSVTTVAPSALRDCKNLVSVSLPSVTSIGDAALSGCSSLRFLSVPNVKEIGRAAAFGAESLTEITLPKSLTSVGENAFKFCTSLRCAIFEGDAPAFGTDPFFGAHLSFTIAVPESASGWGESDSFLNYPLIRHTTYSGTWNGLDWSLNTLSGLLSVMGDAPIPNQTTPANTPWYPYRHSVKEIRLSGVTEIGDNAFRYCTAASVTADSTTRIGDWAFSGCTALTEISAPLTSEIGVCAFFGDSALSFAELGNVSTIGRQAFSACSSLTLLKTTSTKAPEIDVYAFDGTGVSLMFLHAPKAEGFSEGLWQNIPTEGFLKGDANGDGNVNLLDVAAILKKTAGWDVTVTKFSSDFTEDGKLNLLDASGVMKKIAGWQ